MDKDLFLQTIKSTLNKEGYELISEYENAHKTIQLKCCNGHTFSTRWNMFKNGSRCPLCLQDKRQQQKQEMRLTVTKEVEKAGYVLLEEYQGANDKMKMKCSHGHIIDMSWNTFQQGHRCFECSHNMTSIEDIKIQLEKEGYKLLSTEYKDNRTHLLSLCPNGHEWRFAWSKFKSGHRCGECYRSTIPQYSIEHVKERLEAEQYSLISNTYNGRNEKMQATCPKGHTWDFTWGDFKAGIRCGHCHRQSRLIPIESIKEVLRQEGRILGEQEICEHYKDSMKIIEKDRLMITPKELDIYFPEHKVAVEYCGLYWHSDQHERMVSSYHRKKLDLCNEKGIRLITIFEDEWLEHKDICLSRIDNALGIATNKIYARNCEVKEIDNKEARKFLLRTHLQGAGNCKIAFGLFYKDTLVQVMTFGSLSRAHTAKGKKVLELKRLSAELDAIIVGGAGKLFKCGKKYAKENGYEAINSYCDLRWGTGNLYEKLEFVKINETKYTPHYTNGIVRYRNQYLATNKKKEGITESEKSLKKGLYKIYDCGHQTWQYLLS